VNPQLVLTLLRDIEEELTSIEPRLRALEQRRTVLTNAAESLHALMNAPNTTNSGRLQRWQEPSSHDTSDEDTGPNGLPWQDAYEERNQPAS
jgi:hypothetical protein